MFDQRLWLTLVTIAASVAVAVSPVRVFGAQGPVADEQATPVVVSIEVPIAASSDDAGINAASGWCVYGTGHNEIYFGQCEDGTDISSGFRFAQVPIPQGAHIVEAYLRFTVDGPYTGAMTVRFRGEASGNAQAFSDTSRPEDRPLIPDMMADWEITAADPWTLDETRLSPPLTAIVQAIVDRTDWSSGNALAIITQNVGTATGTWRHRRVIGYFGSTSGLSSTPDWTAASDQSGARFGTVSTAGDVNGDGYADVIVGADRYTGAYFQEGQAFVYHGSASGPSITPDWTVSGGQWGAWLGQGVGTAGDVGDGMAM
jgi:hypothetical protein